MSRVVVFGLLLLAAPGLLAAIVLRAPAEPRAWPHSPAVASSPAAPPPPRWDEPARTSLNSLRRLIRAEARRSQVSLAVCEARARHDSGTHRNLHFRRCATAPLARTDGFARSNSRMLEQLAGTAGPTKECRGRVMDLSGAASSLAFTARQTLLTLDAPMSQVLAASRMIREQAKEALAIASAKGWSVTCKTRPPAAAEPGPVI